MIRVDMVKKSLKQKRILRERLVHEHDALALKQRMLREEASRIDALLLARGMTISQLNTDIADLEGRLRKPLWPMP